MFLFPQPVISSLPPAPVLFLLLLAFLLFLHPRVFAGAVNLILSKLKREEITVTISGPRAVMLFSFYLFLWVVQGTAFYLMAASLTGLSLHYLPAMLFIFSSCWVIGYISFIAPGGLGVRMDSALYGGYSIPPHYDSLIGKLIVHGRDRPEALSRLSRALGEIVIEGIDTTLPLFDALLQESDILAGNYDIHWLEKWLAAHGG